MDAPTVVRTGIAAHDDLLARIAVQLQRQDPSGAAAALLSDPDAAAADAASAVLDTASVWHAHVGALYDAKGVGRLLAHPDGKPISRQAVNKRGLLTLRTGSGQVLYPAFQFHARAAVPGVAELLRILPASLVSPWTVASWLVTPAADLGDAAPIDVLRRGQPGPVLAAARSWALALIA